MTTPPSLRRSEALSIPPQPQRTGSRAGRVVKCRNEQFEFSGKTEYKDVRIFLSFGKPEHDVGWKLHVVKPRELGDRNPELPESYIELLVHLRELKIPHKIVSSLRGLTEMETSDQQVGKFITIYPRDTAQLIGLPDQIEPLIKDEALHDGIAIGDLPVCSTRIVGARWGGLTGPNAVDQHNRLIKDDRGRSHPDWIRNPFDKDSKGREGWVRFEDRPEIRALKTDLVSHASGDVSQGASQQRAG
jgi:hypothetical protein